MATAVVTIVMTVAIPAYVHAANRRIDREALGRRGGNESEPGNSDDTSKQQISHVCSLQLFFDTR
jgi:hypothetical protein